MRARSLDQRVTTIGLVAMLVGFSPAVVAQGLELALESTASGLFRPLEAVHAGDGSGRLFIAEQGGQIRIWDDGQLLPRPFLDLTSLVSCCGERGLLALAFHPEYRTNGYFYVGLTDDVGDTVIARYSVSAGDPNVANPSSALTILEVAQPASNHNNDHLAFGPDGYLYIAMGDGGSGSSARGQDLTSLLGKILRIDPNGDDFPTEPNRNYAIPPDNPFVGDPSARDEIWAYGLRNPWRHSFDRELGDLWIGDVGARSVEEIDLQPASSAGGENYGWALMEGTTCFNPPVDCNDGSLTLPVLEYSHSFGCAVTGGYRYRGDREPGLRGVYIYGDFCFGTIWGTVPRCDGEWESQVLLDSGLSISSFGEDQGGEVYVTDLDNNNGRVFRLTRAGTGGPALASSAATLDFGSPAPGAVTTMPLTLTNTNGGPEAVIIDELELSDTVRFSLDLGAGADPCGPIPICLTPGASCTAEVAFGSLGGSFDERLTPDGNFDQVEISLVASVACGGQDHLLVDDVTIDSTAELVGCQTVTVGPDAVFGTNSNVAFRAGVSVGFADGVAFHSGSSARIENDPSLSP